MISKSQPSSTPGDANAQRALPSRWLSEMITAADMLAIRTSGAPDAAGRTSILARDSEPVGRFKEAATPHFAVQRPNRQSSHRLAKRIRLSRSSSRALSQVLSLGTSASACSSQCASIKLTLLSLGRLRHLRSRLPEADLLRSPDSSFHCIDKIGP